MYINPFTKPTFLISSNPSLHIEMHSVLLVAFAALASLAAAAPQPQTTSAPATPVGIFTNASVADPAPYKLKARGYKGECVDCPPEPPKCDRYKGCLYIECSDDCEDENCCECIGLETYKPYVNVLSRCLADFRLVPLLRLRPIWISAQSPSQR